MNDSALLLTALITGLIGIIGLYFLSDSIEMNSSTISEVQEMKEYDDVRINGTVSRVFQKENFTIITLARQEYVKVVLFDNIMVKEGEQLDVVGQIKEYKGETEIIAEKISKG